MGRFVKNQQIGLGNTAIGIPVGSASERPDEPVFGQIRFNTDSGKVEYYDGIIWSTVSKQGDVAIEVDSFTGDSVTTVFTMSENVIDEEQVLVFVGSIYQIPVTNYTVSGNYDITFASAPPSTTPINIIHGLGSTGVS